MRIFLLLFIPLFIFQFHFTELQACGCNQQKNKYRVRHQTKETPLQIKNASVTKNN